MSLFLSESKENLPLSRFAMRRMLKPNRHSDSDSSNSVPKGKSVDPDDDPDKIFSHVSSSLNGAKKPAAVTTKENEVDKAKSTPKATKEKCQCKGCPGLPPTHLRPLVECGIESCQKQLHHICYEKMINSGNTAQNDLFFCTLGHHNKYVKGKRTTIQTTYIRPKKMRLF